MPPYEAVGSQCLFFSRPHPPWGILPSWDQVASTQSTTGFSLKLMNLVLQAYKSVYDAAIFCLEHGGSLAERVEEPEEAVEHCTQIQGASPRQWLRLSASSLHWIPAFKLDTWPWKHVASYTCSLVE